MNTFFYKSPDKNNIKLERTIPYATNTGITGSPILSGFVASTLHIVRNASPYDPAFYLYTSRTYDGNISFTLSDDPFAADPLLTLVELVKPDGKDPCVILAVPRNTSFRSCELIMEERSSVMLGVPTENSRVLLHGTETHLRVPSPDDGGTMVKNLTLVQAVQTKSTANVSAQNVCIDAANGSTLRADVDEATTLCIQMPLRKCIVVTSGRIAGCPEVRFSNEYQKGNGQLYTHVGWIDAPRNPVVPAANNPKDEDPRFSYVPINPHRSGARRQNNCDKPDHK